MHVKTEEIRRIRRERDFSQEYMAEMLNLSQSQYSRLENNESPIDFEKIGKIAIILDVNPFDILEFSEQSFINCSQSGNINTINNNEDFKNERESYLQQIKELKEDKEFLKQEIISLKKLLDKLS
ncbi:helix-turn-helix transcriptional regulator [Elizabethkingia anophelis]|nr:MULTISPECIES: helix-turn-helix transcriptional regulator [Elizabethkingia]MCT3991081.1 helix-turn-helix transcriptional regulator [Elizabethkingia anophelis]EJK5329457.1 helix-turn-helix transcriptional regulator [Elizabethkingia meningoseptica]MCT4008881.1 helix-turn-helix transcriptional regulator [Elizabethkingia anophelis]MCT4315847.1 helix-turn-helix transcriptional regulator [Elizabethkingia anophelis]WBS75860.1 helix-turn-helix transcriptional regulator [Elizabethkingia meningoseptic